MSKKKTRNQHKSTLPAQRRRPRLKAIILIAVVALSSVAILAERGGLKLGKRGFPASSSKGTKGVAAKSGSAPAKPAQESPQSVSSPSKEYIYVDGRLVATQEGGSPTSTPTPTPPPSGQPLNLAGVPGEGGVMLTWTYGGTGQSDFVVQRELTGSSPFTTIGTASPSVFTFTDNTAAAGSSYNYQVLATNTGGSSVASNVITVSLPSGAPPAPSGIVAQEVSSAPNPQVSVTWQYSGSNEQGFKLERAPSGGSFAQIAVLCAGTTSYPDPAVTVPGAYTYQVKAYNAAGDSAYSTSSLLQLPPPAPVLSLGTVGVTTVQISWTESVTVDSFTVLRNGTAVAAGTNLSNTTTSFTDTGLTPSTQYTYQVQANSALGGNSVSNSVSTSTGAGCQVTNFSGSGTAGYAEGAGSAAQWASPLGCAAGIDPSSGYHSLFIADTDNNRIRMIYLEGPNVGESMLVAGDGTAGFTKGGGNPLMAEYNTPQGLGVITDSNDVVSVILIADTVNDEIRELTWSSSGWTPNHLAGQPGVAGSTDGNSSTNLFNAPNSVAYDAANGLIYVADTGNGVVRQLDTSGNSSTLDTPSLQSVTAVALDSANNLFIVDQTGSTVYEYNLNTDTLAGQFTGFSRPVHLTVTTSGGADLVYVADKVAEQVFQIMVSSSTVTVYAGTGTAGAATGPCTTVAQFSKPHDVAVGPSGEVYVIDSGNNMIRRAQ